MEKINTLRAHLEKDSAFIFLSPVNRQYFTGVHTSYGLVCVTHTAALFYTDFRYLELAERRVFEGITIRKFSEGICGTLQHLIQEFSLKQLILEPSYITVAQAAEFSALPIVFDTGNLPGEMRMKKSSEEIRAIVSAQEITDQAYQAILKEIKIGMTEKEVMARLIYHMYRLGAEALAFDPIVVSGANGALPHGVAGDKKLQNGEFLTMDFGAVKNGYCSDMTRTVALGHCSERMKTVYDTVLHAAQCALKTVRAGVIGKEVDAAARAYIDRQGFAGHFDHSTGHGIGIEIHEAPNFSPREEHAIPEGAVLSIEPGIYLPGELGVRVENMVLVRPNGGEILTKSPTELLILK